MGKHIRLYWWSEIYIQKLDKENYGDLLGKYLIEKISGKPVKWYRANKFYFKNLWQPLYVSIGSVLEHIGPHCTVWGSGIISRDSQIAAATFLAVRGPLTRKRLLDLGYNCPTIYGDPALLLPMYYNPIIEKKFKLGIVPHISDYELVYQWHMGEEDIKVIDFRTNNVEQTTDDILACDHILSSSLHGLIVAHAYQIPAVQVRFSNNIHGDGVKYHDYFMSVDLNTYTASDMEQAQDVNASIAIIKNHVSALPSSAKINQVQQDLLAVCPFNTTSI
jgi:pyruvyltransferase